MPFRCLLLLFLLFVEQPLSGQEKAWPVERGAARDAAKQAAFSYDAVKKAPADFLTDYPAFYLYASTLYRIEVDGTVECTTHEVIRLNNRKGIDLVGEHRNVTFNPNYEKVTLNEARVIKSERRSVSIEPRHVQVRDVQTDYSVYDTSKELIISFPGLEAGDIIDVEWTTRGKNPEYAGQFFTRYHFGEDRIPIWQETFNVWTAKNKPLRYSLINAVVLPDPKMKPQIADEGDGKKYTWRVLERRPLPKEEHLPSKEEIRPGVAITTFETWDAVAAWERHVRKGCDECTPELKEVVRRIKQEYKEPEAVARELTRWFRDNIRYVSTGDKHDFTPHAPATVYKNRFGDCKDGVQFLWVLLREAGISAGQASLSPLGDGQILEEVPCPWSTHAILRVPLNGKVYWIDTTAAHAAWDLLPYNDCDRVCYIVDDKSFEMSRTPKYNPDENRTESVTTVTFEKDGTSHNSRVLTFFGEAAMQKRDDWADVSAKERRRLIRTELLDVQSKAQLKTVEFDEANMRNPDEPLRVKISFDVPKQLHGNDELEGSISDNTLWTPLLGITVDVERESPLELTKPFVSKNRFIIEAPKDYALEEPPDPEDVQSEWGSFHLKAKGDAKGRRWTIDMDTRLEKTRVDKADLAEFANFQEEIQAAFHVDIVLKPLDN